MPDILDCGDGTRLKPLQASNRKPADGSYDIGCAVPYGFQRLWHRHSSMSVILVRHLAGKKIHGTTTYHSSRSHMRGVPWGMHRNRIAMDCAAYCCTTFIVGCLLAYVGAHVGLRFAGTEHNDGDRHAMGKEAD